MLKIGRLTDYGILMLHQLARVRPARLPMESIAETTHLPLPTVRKVMRYLADAGLVVSKRGPNGGYEIARPPEAITLREAVAAIEGNLALTDCCDPLGQCEIANRCGLSDRWPGINAIVAEALERVTLADLATGGRGAPTRPAFLQPSVLQSPG
ncbi:MAG: SUF system Fe-S cluster assembly regulator [Pseudomonadota bacterium]|nr:SUF system Fe-S cluster assembly regulator [Pseudomonadota bacterium]